MRVYTDTSLTDDSVISLDMIIILDTLYAETNLPKTQPFKVIFNINLKRHENVKLNTFRLSEQFSVL
jgi:hypothetical protein